MGDLNKLKGKIGNLDSPTMPFDYSQREYGTVPRDTKRAPFQWVSEVAYKNVHRIVSRGYDTTELMEEGYGVVDVLFVDFQVGLLRLPVVVSGVLTARKAPGAVVRAGQINAAGLGVVDLHGDDVVGVGSFDRRVIVGWRGAG